jgi:hypothetical protein
MELFRQGLGEGWFRGSQNVAIEHRWAKESFKCPDVARNRHADAVYACPLLRDQRTSPGRGSKSENDPNRTYDPDSEYGDQEFESVRARHFGTLLTPRPAVLPMQAVELHPRTARLTISLYCDDELSALSPSLGLLQIVAFGAGSISLDARGRS